MDLTGTDIIGLADHAKSVKDEMEKAKETKCTCSGFALQYQGCGCIRGQRLKKAQTKVDEFFAGI